jgi:hypothetical protein
VRAAAPALAAARPSAVSSSAPAQAPARTRRFGDDDDDDDGGGGGGGSGAGIDHDKYMRMSLQDRQRFSWAFAVVLRENLLMGIATGFLYFTVTDSQVLASMLLVIAFLCSRVGAAQHQARKRPHSAATYAHLLQRFFLSSARAGTSTFGLTSGTR